MRTVWPEVCEKHGHINPIRRRGEVLPKRQHDESVCGSLEDEPSFVEVRASVEKRISTINAIVGIEAIDTRG